MLTKIKENLLLWIIVFTSQTAIAQATSPLSLTEAVLLARKNSIDYKIAVNMAQSAHWNSQVYKSTLLPKLSINGTFPEYYRTINPLFGLSVP